MAATATGCGGDNANAMKCGRDDKDQEIWLAEEEGGRSTTARRAGGAEAKDVDVGYSMEDW